MEEINRNRIKDGILIALIIVLLIVLGVGWNQFNRLEEQYNQIKNEQVDYRYKIDSLSKINNQQAYIIDSISLNIYDLQKDIADLNKDKQELESQLDDFQIKTNLDENVILLRDNIWKYSH